MTEKSDVLLSACMIVKDEEENLPRCLTSMLDLADEFVIIDTGSTDRTVEIARSFGARVYHEPWQNDFSLHRNQSLERATGKWHLVPDADDEIVDTDKEETRRYLRRDDMPTFLTVRHLIRHSNGPEITIFAPRVFRADAGYRYKHRIHEQPDTREQTGLLSNIIIRHHGYETDEALQVKQERNLRLALEMPDDCGHALHCRARAAMALRRWDTAAQACEALVDRDVSVVLTLEACVLGIGATLHLRKPEKQEWFLKRALATAPEHPDVHFMELLVALRRYEDSLNQHGDSMGPGEYIRPWVYLHSRARVKAVRALLIGSDFEEPTKNEEEKR